jgi:hypothetical protein
MLSDDERRELVTLIPRLFAVCAYHCLCNRALNQWELRLAESFRDTLKRIEQSIQSGDYDPRIINPTREMVSEIQPIIDLWQSKLERYHSTLN